MQADLRNQLGKAARESPVRATPCGIVRQQFQDLYQELLSEKTQPNSVGHNPISAVKSTPEGRQKARRGC